MSNTATIPRPVGVLICWDLKPGSVARCCTRQPRHHGDHHHEYSGTSWPQTKGGAR